MCTVAGNECCSNLGLSCISFDGQQGFCGDDSCPGFGQLCTPEGTCCEGYVCDVSGLCLEALSCSDLGGACEDLFDCCGSLVCAGSECVEAGCNPTSCHDPYEVGPPMSGCNDDVSFADCIATMVAGDAWCGCVEWDFVCVDTALATCAACGAFE